MNVTLRSKSSSETKRLGRGIGRLLKAGDVVAFYGNLGSGKTTLIKGIAGGLGVRRSEETVVSPTFVLINEYHGREKIFHIDWYRLDAVSGHDRMLAVECFDSPAVSLVEWADRGKDLLPRERLEIRLKHAGERRRIVQIVGKSERYRGLLKRLQMYTSGVYNDYE